MSACFPHASVSRAWLSEAGFQWLFTMVGVNGQGVGTSVFSQWVERVGDSVDESTIDQIYEKLMDREYLLIMSYITLCPTAYIQIIRVINK